MNVAALAVAFVCAPAAARARLANSEAPYMGVDTWYAFGPDIDQAKVVALANQLVARGLKAAGYRYLWLDAGWWQGRRDRRGRIVVDRRQWPRGMRWLASYIHSKGLRAGIYTDAGIAGCDNAGSYRHYRRDVDQFARWGFDAVKVDFCGGHRLGLNPRAAFGAFSRAIREDRPRRPMLLAICNGATPGEKTYNRPTYAESAYDSYSFAPAIADSWRTGPDIGWPGYVPFSAVLRNIALDALHPGAAGPNHWNDPDYLAPGLGMTRRQARAQFTMWTILAAPLMLSADVAKLPRSTLRMLTNRAAIAIDQDPRGVQGRRVAGRHRVSVWVKPLSGDAVAVAVLNRSRRTASATVPRSLLGISAGRGLRVENVWGDPLRRVGRSLRVTVPGDGAALLRFSAR